jgi:hypothetical protein
MERPRGADSFILCFCSGKENDLFRGREEARPEDAMRSEIRRPLSLVINHPGKETH